MIDLLRQVYRSCVPRPIRAALRRFVPERAIDPGISYSDGYFGYLDEQQAASFRVMAQSLIRLFHPRSVIDVGCGSGGLLAQLAQAGVPDCRGIEYSYAGRQRCRALGIAVSSGDLSKRCFIDPEIDLCICMEVAEHIPPQFADQVVRNLTAGPKLLLFSAATVGQGGHDHVNEQSHSYWIEKFAKNGYQLDEAATAQLRADWGEQSVVPWLTRNAMLFRRS
jgi:SAM-dependent methyltransferase